MRYLTIIALLFLTGCDTWVHRYVEKTELKAFYYHSEWKYTGMALNEKDELVVVRIENPTIKLDATDYAWYECDYEYNTWNGSEVGGCTVHLKSMGDINGAGWSRGKFGSGTTTNLMENKQ